MSEPILTKKCSKCQRTLPSNYFNIKRDNKDGLRSSCKQCRSQYRQVHRTEINQYNKRYRQVHREEINRYRQAHEEYQNYQRNYQRNYYNTINGHLRAVWHAMLNRCSNPTRKDYKYYGARGIKVCFISFEHFYDYVVKELKIDPRGLTIDRINNNGNYEKDNIRFISHIENCHNRRKRQGAKEEIMPRPRLLSVNPNYQQQRYCRYK